MTASTTFGPGSVLSALGVKGGRLPRIATGLIQPVSIYSDFSSSLAPESIEARGLTGASRVVPVGRHFACELHSRSAGGLVIEWLDLTGEAIGFPGDVWLCTISTSRVSIAPDGIGVEQIGGIPPVSAFFFDQPLTAELPVGHPAAFKREGSFENRRIYVGPGSFFYCWYNQPAADGQLSLAWREIPEAIGPA